MSPRPSTYSDAEFLSRALTSLLARGPEASLAEIGADVGLTGARVGQLYGSKAGLMIAVARHYGEQSRARLDAATALDAPPLDRLIEGLVVIASSYVGPDQFPNAAHLMLRVGEDPQYASLVDDYKKVHDGFVRTCLREAVKRGDLKSVTVDELFEDVIAMANGVYLTYVLRNDRALATSLRARLASLLRPYRRAAIKASRRGVPAR